ncbi:FecR family protein [Novosphingobium sp.]|uniref:FecR family protein n=1 Tax=Novosphingobium sp. TaxID=1874826 RepID=UPI002FE3E5B8
MIFRSKPESVNRQAADWLARLHADDRSAGDEAEFHAWLRSDPSHASAFEKASGIWDGVGGLRDYPREAPAVQPRSHSRRAVLAGGAGLILTCGLGLGWQQAQAGVYQTGVGEQRRFLLDDATRIMLDTNTRVRFTTDTSKRLLSLTSGRIDIEIAGDTRPFVIEAGDSSAVANAGRLDLRREDETVVITAIEGSAKVRSPEANMVLVAGSRVAVELGRKDRLDQPEIDDLLAWQSGRLSFRDETVAQAAAEMNRYTRRKLIVSDPRAANMRLSGVYRVGDPEGFAQSLAELLPVKVALEPNAIRIVAAR